MNTPTTQIKSFQDLTTQVRGLMSKSASGVPAAPEKDERHAGSPAPPAQGGSDPGSQNMPAAQPDNKDITPANPAPALAPAETIVGTEKVANLAKRAGAIVQGVQALMKSATAAGTTKVDPHLPDGATTNANKDKAATGCGKVAGDGGNMPADEREQTAPKAKVDDKGNLPPDEKKNMDKTASAPAAPVAAPAAPADVLEIDPQFAMKVASVMLQSEDRITMVEGWMKEEMGAEEARSIIKAAAVMEQVAAQSIQAEADGAAAMDDIWTNASEGERNQMLKIAGVYKVASENLQPEDLAYFENGMKMAANMMTAGLAGPESAGMPPEAMDPEAPVSPDDVLAAVELLISQGLLDEATAQQILAGLSGDPAMGGGGDPMAAAAGGAPLPPEAGGGAPLPPEAAAGDEAPLPPEGGGGEGGGGEKKKSPPEESGDESPAEKEARAIFKQASVKSGLTPAK